MHVLVRGYNRKVCSVTIEKEVGTERGTPHKRKMKGLEKKLSDFPNLWCRGGRGDAKAALFVSAEHKLP